MSRLSRRKKREDKRAERSAAPVTTTPIAVHVPRTPSVTGTGAGAPDGPGKQAWASVGGVRVEPAPGEEIQQAVLDHLHRIAVTTGRTVLATVTDERIDYVVPLQVHGDGSSTLTAEPRRTAARDGDVREDAPREQARRDTATQVLRQAPGPARETAPTFPLRAVPESGSATGPSSGPESGSATGPSSGPGPRSATGPSSGSAPTFALRAVADPAAGTSPATARATPPAVPPGTATAPLGRFGPPPVMDAGPSAAATAPPAAEKEPAPPFTAPAPASWPSPALAPEAAAAQATAAPTRVDPGPGPGVGPGTDADPKPTPARGFDAVAEAVLGDDPRAAAGEGGPALLAEPTARISEAVKAGRIEEAAALAEHTVTEASGTLGAEHPEVLRLRELCAYIAYLAGDPLRAFRLSIELARIHHGTGDEEGAYGNVQSAATAWRAVRDPEQGLRLGHDLVGLWTALTAGGGPAADDIEELESARARMGRLAERARRQAPPPTN